MKYIAKPVEVNAFVIKKIGDANPDTTVDVGLDNNETVVITAAMMSRMVPQVGDYLVIQSDGYQYLNPKDVFERKYRPAQNEESRAFNESLSQGRINLKSQLR